MKLSSGPGGRDAIFKHPFVLAGLAVVALLGITAASLVVLDSARGDSATDQHVGIEPRDTQTPGPIAKTATANGLNGKTNTTTAVLRTPGARAALGTLPRNTEVIVDGRSAEGKWYRIIFPPESELHGWVDADQIDITGDQATLPVATPEPIQAVDLPTTDPSLRLTPVDTVKPDATDTPVVATATPDTGLPDLVVGTTPVLSQGKLFVTVINQGTGVATGDLVIAIFSADGSELLGGATLDNFSLATGKSIDVGTGYAVTKNQTLLLIVDPNGEIDESDNTNNRITITIAVGGDQAPTPAP